MWSLEKIASQLNCEDMKFKIRNFAWIKTFVDRQKLPTSVNFQCHIKCYIFAICEAIFSDHHIFTNFNKLFPAMIIIFCTIWVFKWHDKPSLWIVTDCQCYYIWFKWRFSMDYLMFVLLLISILEQPSSGTQGYIMSLVSRSQKIYPWERNLLELVPNVKITLVSDWSTFLYRLYSGLSWQLPYWILISGTSNSNRLSSQGYFFWKRARNERQNIPLSSRGCWGSSKYAEQALTYVKYWSTWQ